LLRDALDALLEDDQRSRRLAAARAAIGAFRSGTSDTSERHDEALAEAFRQ
jgi:hypothetical protein